MDLWACGFCGDLSRGPCLTKGEGLGRVASVMRVNYENKSVLGEWA